jgi:hypothetical protein
MDNKFDVGGEQIVRKPLENRHRMVAEDAIKSRTELENFVRMATKKCKLNLNQPKINYSLKTSVRAVQKRRTYKSCGGTSP